MPVPLLNRYIGELPRITASESLVEAERVMVGAGRMKRNDRRRILSSWERLAEQSKPPLRPRSKGEARVMAGMVGIRVVPVPRRAPD